MRGFGFAVLGGLVGFVLGILLGVGLVQLLSSNRHDRAQEAVMTGFFVTGPIVAILGFVVTLVVLWSRARSG